MSIRDEVFEGATTADLIWGRDGGDATHRDEWHIIGPRMPRMAPVSPTSIAPCGYLLAQDSLRRLASREPAASHTPEAFPEVPVCTQCERFREQLGWRERDAKAVDNAGAVS